MGLALLGRAGDQDLLGDLDSAGRVIATGISGDPKELGQLGK